MLLGERVPALMGKVNIGTAKRPGRNQKQMQSDGSTAIHRKSFSCRKSCYLSARSELVHAPLRSPSRRRDNLDHRATGGTMGPTLGAGPSR